MPSTFGRYRVVRPVGEGAMAAVFEVEDTALGVRRALKVLHPEVAANPDLRARFDAEARTMAQLRHPHLVAVHDVGESEGRPWMVMDLAEGGSLADRVTREGALDACVVLGEMLGVLDALAVVHAAGVIHRDVKPQNLLYDGAGTLRLADFGIALTEGLELTRTGMVLGSWGFMAPEQRLDPRKVRPATDLFGLAASAVWAIVGGPVSDLHVGEHRAVLLRDVSDDVSGVLHRALAFRPEERYRSAGEMRAAIVEVLGAAVGGGGAAEGTEEGLTQRNRGTEEQQQEGGGTASGMAGGARAGGRVSEVGQRDSWGGEGAAPPFHVGPRNAPPLGQASRSWVLGAGVIALGTVGTAGAALALVLRGTDTPTSAAVAIPSAAAAVGDATKPGGDTTYPACPDAVSEWVEDVRMGPRETTAATLADVDQDGNLDALFTNQLDETVSIWWGRKGAMPEADRQDVPIGRSQWAVAVGDVDGDGFNDLVAGLQDDSAFGIVRGLGRRRFAKPVREFQSPPPQQVALVDQDGDGRLDLVFRQRGRIDLRQQVNGTWAPHRALTQEGSIDILFAGLTRGPFVQLLLAQDGRLELRNMNGDATNVDPSAVAWVYSSTMITAQRARDGFRADSEAYARRTDNSLLRLDGVGAPCLLSGPVPSWHPSAVGDLDGDGVPDVVSVASCRSCTSNHVFLRGTR